MPPSRSSSTAWHLRHPMDKVMLGLILHVLLPLGFVLNDFLDHRLCSDVRSSVVFGFVSGLKFPRGVLVLRFRQGDVRHVVVIVVDDIQLLVYDPYMSLRFRMLRLDVRGLLVFSSLPRLARGFPGGTGGGLNFAALL